MIPDGGTDTVTGTVISSSTNLTYAVANLGNAALTVANFTQSAATNCTLSFTTQPATSVAAAGSSNLVVSITPTAASWSVALSSVTNDGNENPYNWTISGTASAAPAPEAEVTRGATAITDGGTDTVTGTVISTPTSLTYTITNSGTANLTVAAFTQTAASNCAVTVTTQPTSPVTAAGTTTLVITVTPSAASWSANLSGVTNDGNENPYNWTISGTATNVLAPEADITRGATGITDGGTDAVTGLVASTATPLTYTITNNGSAPLTLSDFTTGTLINCAVTFTQPAASVGASGGTTTLVVSVTPGVGDWSAVVTGANNDLNENPYNWTISGTTAPEADVTRSAAAIADGGTDTVTTAVAGTASTLTYTITNSGTAPLTLGAFATSGTLTNCTVSFTTQPGTPVTASATTSLVLSVTPTTAAAWSVVVTGVTNDSNENPYNWTISGTATAGPVPEADVTRGATAVADGGTNTVTGSVAGIASSLTYTITNSGTAALTLGAFATSGTSTNCTVSFTTQPGTSVAASATTSLILSVTPTAVGAWSVMVTGVTNDSNENPYNWAISGSATAAPAPDANVTRGASAIADNGSDAIAGTTPGVATAVTYTITNAGSAALTVGNFAVGSLVNCTVSITTQPAGSVAASATTSLVIAVTPTATGAWSANLSATTNDSNGNPYNWAITGGAGGGGSTTNVSVSSGGCGAGGAFGLIILGLAFLPLRRRHGDR